MDYIIGHFIKSIYVSDQGYVIGLFKVKDTNIERLKSRSGTTVTFTGYFYELNENDLYKFYGDYIKNDRYGYQLQVSSYEKIMPTEKEGIVDFLSSDLFPGIGTSLAKKIANTLGTNALEEIEKDPSCLNLVPKLTQTKAELIVKKLKEYNKSSKTIVYLTNLGFRIREAFLIYNEYKERAINKADNNVYEFLNVKGISFTACDLAGRSLNIPKDDERRILALTIYTMEIMTYQDGDTYLLKEDIKKAIFKNFNIDIEIEKYLEKLKEINKIVIYEDKYYLKDIWDAEEVIVKRVSSLIRTPKRKYEKLEETLEKMQKDSHITYNDEQKEAIKTALENSISLITGGPGTGKTTIIKAITESYKLLNHLDDNTFIKNLALLAPTGRASKRMSEATNLPASTIHRFLKWNKDTAEFIINENNKAKSKLIIIDEVSMIDVNLFSSLLKGLNESARIVLVGDYNQLPSVGPGVLLKDFITSNLIQTVSLSKLYRQDEGSYITVLASEIKDGALSEKYLNNYNDYKFLTCQSINIKPNLKKIVKQISDKGYDYKRLQLLAPIYKGENGIDLLNKELQEVLNPKTKSKKQIKIGDVTFREGDKILQLVNMPDENIFNGDIGILSKIETEGKKHVIYVDYDDNTVKYTPKDFNKIKHGFIISIHKSQGSEFEMVIMPICHSYKRMLYRKLVYTGITRAKKKLILIGEPDIFESSMHNNEEYIRKSLLAAKLQYKFNQND